MLMTAIPAKVVLETVNKKKVRNVNLKKTCKSTAKRLGL